MLIDLKYHIVSLIAVFLALGFGILVGSTLLPNTLILDRQNAIITKLEKDFQKIREENQKIKSKIKVSQNFERKVFPVLIKDKLKGIKLNILEIFEEEDYKLRDSLTDVLKISGAEIKSITFIKDNFGMDKKQKREKVCKHLGLNSQERERAILNVSLRLANEIAQGGKTPLLDYLKEENLIYIKGNYTESSKYLLLVTKERDEAKWEYLILPMLKVFKEKGVEIIGTETTDVENSTIPYYKDKDISTVDNIDSIYGKVALVYLFSGKEGNFGIKKTASSLIPELE